MPWDLFRVSLIEEFIVLKDLCQKFPSTSSTFLSEDFFSVFRPSVVLFLNFRVYYNQEQFLIGFFCLLDILKMSFYYYFVGDFIYLLDRFSFIRLFPYLFNTGGGFIPLKRTQPVLPKLDVFPELVRNIFSGDFGLNS